MSQEICTNMFPKHQPCMCKKQKRKEKKITNAEHTNHIYATTAKLMTLDCLLLSKIKEEEKISTVWNAYVN